MIDSLGVEERVSRCVFEVFKESGQNLRKQAKIVILHSIEIGPKYCEAFMAPLNSNLYLLERYYMRYRLNEKRPMPPLSLSIP